MIDVKVGDHFRLMWVRSYQHGASMVVDKVNAKTFKATEIPRSYSPGQTWVISKNAKFGIFRFEGEDWTHIDWFDKGEFEYVEKNAWFGRRPEGWNDPK